MAKMCLRSNVTDVVSRSFEMFRMTFDYHTHTIYSPGPVRSHGKGTPEENVQAAIEKGLKGIGISDHGPGHLTYGIKREKISELHREILRLRKVYPQIEIYLSVEANIVQGGNFLDVRPEEFPLFDFVNAGYHFGVRNAYVPSNFAYNKGLRKGAAEKFAKRNTDIITGALGKNDIKILTHPGDKAPVEMKRIAAACEKSGTWMEVNNSHGHLDVDELKICEPYDVKFIVSSDAHRPEKVGSFETALERILEAGIDISRVVNIEEV